MDEKTKNFMNWMVPCRAENQTTTVYLLNICIDFQKEISEREDVRQTISMLANSCFSLWRAVFLGNTTGDLALVMTNVEDFLEKLILTNTVTFATDAQFNEWSFRFYMVYAQLTMDFLQKNANEMDLLIPDHWPSKTFVTAESYWRQVHQVLSTATERLRVYLEIERTRPRDQSKSIDGLPPMDNS